MGCVLLFAGLWLGIPNISTAQMRLEGFEAGIPKVKFDRVQIHPVRHNCPQRMKRGALHIQGDANSLAEVCVLATFSLDAKDQVGAYFLGIPGSSALTLLVFDRKSRSFMLDVQLAEYVVLPGAMKSLTNAWIVDIDHDRKFEIMITVDLTDYEFPTAEAPNISGTKRFGYRLVKGKMEYFEWPQNLDLGKMISETGVQED